MTPDQFRAAMLALGWSAEETARRLGISPRTVRRYKAGNGEISKTVAILIGIYVQAAVALSGPARMTD